MKAAEAYGLLDLPETASKAEVKATYRKLAMQYHPDRFPEANAAAATRWFQKLKSAYEAIIDDKLETEYSHQQKESKNKPPPPPPPPKAQPESRPFRGFRWFGFFASVCFTLFMITTQKKHSDPIQVPPSASQVLHVAAPSIESVSEKTFTLNDAKQMTRDYLQNAVTLAGEPYKPTVEESKRISPCLENTFWQWNKPDYTPSPERPEGAMGLYNNELNACLAPLNEGLESFVAGKKARTEYEIWMKSLPEGEFKQGALLWIDRRSTTPDLSCASFEFGEEWQTGCNMAKEIFQEIDINRKTDKKYRKGWNSFENIDAQSKANKF